jgi:hypothetical protein
MATSYLFDSCDHYGGVNANILTYGGYTATGGTPTLSVQDTRNCIQLPTSGTLKKTVSIGIQGPAYAVSFWFKPTALSAGGNIFTAVNSGGTPLVTIDLNANGSLTFTGIDVFTTSSSIIYAGNWFFVSFSVRTGAGANAAYQSANVANSAGILSASSFQFQTNNTALVTASSTFKATPDGAVYYDDLILTGGVDVLESSIIRTLPIYGAGATTQWTGAVSGLESTFNDGVTSEITSTASGLIEKVALGRIDEIYAPLILSVIVDALNASFGLDITNTATATTASIGSISTSASSYGAGSRGLNNNTTLTSGTNYKPVDSNPAGNLVLTLTSTSASPQSISALYVEMLGTFPGTAFANNITTTGTLPRPRTSTASLSNGHTAKTTNVTGTLPHPRTSAASITHTATETITAQGTLPHPRTSAVDLKRNTFESLAISGVLPRPLQSTSILVDHFPKIVTEAGTLPRPLTSTAAVARSAARTVAAAGTLPHPRTSTGTIQRSSARTLTVSGTLPHPRIARSTHTMTVSGTLPRPRTSSISILRHKSVPLTISGTLPHPRVSSAVIHRVGFKTITMTGAVLPGRSSTAAIAVSGTRTITSAAGTLPAPRTSSATLLRNTLEVIFVNGVLPRPRIATATLADNGPKFITASGTLPRPRTSTAVVRGKNQPKFMMIVTTG